MTREAQLAADIYEKIEDEKVRFFWLKLRRILGQVRRDSPIGRIRSAAAAW